MYRTTKRIFLSNKGFTLLEALFQFIVFMLLANIFIMFVLWLNQMNKTLMTNENVAWELFVQDVQQLFTNIREITVKDEYGQVEIAYVDSLERKQINRTGDVIRLQTNDKGYVPLLIGIRKVQFHLQDEFLTIIVEFQDGEVRERTFFVQTTNK
ncbi:ComGF family competence protein [Ureibacillus sp. Re31]|uniref:ComGF family competence protein n=1 Tax=Ureibacillus galli TaxID=2762222 RepID=A0ABR8XAE7_9BACL|nr:competence type IV pilus minor pilin ComGF [Ureibacillus galli]MBD8026082.1 ComGF family competence protein [Ureibacillus galli]